VMRLAGADYYPRSPADAIKRGVGFVSGRRAEESLAPQLLVLENLFLNPISDEQSHFRLIRKRAERVRARAALERFSVRPSDPDRTIDTLSGGNQQKVVLARWLERGSSLLVLEEPTFGVDVGAKAEIYAILDRVLEAGSGIVLVSSDFEEVAGICHRALAFSRGRLVAELQRDELSIARLTELTGGMPSNGDQPFGTETTHIGEGGSS
jgi:ribose transport system ATP-binding protein